jgi:hypothetical protein
MKISETTSPKAFKGTGYLTGALIGIVAAVAAFAITENIAIAIPLLAGLSIPIGMSIERKLQSESGGKGKHADKLMIALIAIGVLFFFSLIFITRFI